MSNGWQKTEHYPAREDADLAALLYNTGLLYLVNVAVLHNHGLALAINVNDEGTIDGLALNASNDPEGVWFDDESTTRARRKLAKYGLSFAPAVAHIDSPRLKCDYDAATEVVDGEAGNE